MRQSAIKHKFETNGCWSWMGYVGRNGYGSVNVNKKPWLAHRFYYQRAKGDIKDGLQIDHICKNKICVNPDHLEAVTPRENTLRCDNAPASINFKKTHCIHGHSLSGVNLYITPNGRRNCKKCRSNAVRRIYLANNSKQ